MSESWPGFRVARSDAARPWFLLSRHRRAALGRATLIVYGRFPLLQGPLRSDRRRFSCSRRSTEARVGLVAPLVNGDSIDFFDENLILSGQLVYPISPIMELALQVQSNVIDGKWYPSWGILTRLNG